MEQQIAEKRDSALLKMNDNVAVTMRWTEIVQANGVVRQMEGKAVGESLARRVDHDGIVVGWADAISEPRARGVALRRELEDILPEQEAQLGGEIRNQLAVASARTEAGIHSREHLLVRQDRRVREHRTSRRVIEMAVGVDDRAQRFAGLAVHRVAECAREPRILLRMRPPGVSIAPAFESSPAPIHACTPSVMVTRRGSDALMTKGSADRTIAP